MGEDWKWRVYLGMPHCKQMNRIWFRYGSKRWNVRGENMSG